MDQQTSPSQSYQRPRRPVIRLIGAILLILLLMGIVRAIIARRARIQGYGNVESVQTNYPTATIPATPTPQEQKPIPAPVPTPTPTPAPIPGPKPKAAGTYVETLTFNNTTRAYKIVVPANYDAMIIALHPLGTSKEFMETMTGFSNFATQYKYIVVYPDGTKNNNLIGNGLSWEPGFMGHQNQVNDTDFVSVLIDTLKAQYKPTKTFVTGFSNGAILTHWVGARYTTKVDALGIVSGAVAGAPAGGSTMIYPSAPAKPINVLIMHGLADGTIPVAGNAATRFREGFVSLAASVKFWTDNNKCSTPSKTVSGKATITTYADCSNSTMVKLYELEGWKHLWPTQAGADTDATQTVLTFFGLKK